MRVLVLDGYARVSRVGARRGDAFASPEQQRDAITAKIAALGGTLGQFICELDVSGGKAARDRKLEKLIQRVESGESSGIVVYDYSRVSPAKSHSRPSW